MKPRYLSIQAFGPFNERQEIDFGQLGTSPLFLINGATGAGKSSILDAICFALYGQTTSHERDAQQMRCQHASLSTKTEICFEFSIAGKHYRILRSPTQARSKSRGGGVTTENTSAHLWHLDNQTEQLIVAKSATRCTKEIELITGLTIEQFRQVMILPQGKFRDFLLANSQQRETIFSQLFQTQIFKQIENKLKEQSQQIKKQAEAYQEKINGALLSADLEKLSDVDKELDQLKPEHKALSEKKAAAEKQLKTIESALHEAEKVAKAFAELSIKKQALAEHDAALEQQQQDQTRLESAQKADKISALKATLTQSLTNQKTLECQRVTAAQKLTVLEKEHQQARQVLEAQQQNQAQHDQWRLEIDSLKKLRPQVEKLTDLNHSLTSLNATANQQKNHIIQIKQTLDADKKAVQALETTLQQDLEQLQLLPEHKAQRFHLETVGQLLATKDKLIGQITSEQNNLASALSKESAAKDQLNQHEVQLKKLELHWHHQQAIRLATELQHDAPCPVCGSTEHPKLAQPSGDIIIISESELSGHRTLVKKLAEELQSAIQNKVALQTRCDNLNQTLTELNQQLGDKQNTSTKAIRSAWQAVNKIILRLEAINEQQKNQLQALENKRQAIVATEQSLEKYQFAYEQAQQKRNEVEQQTALITRSLPKAFNDAKAFNDYLARQQERLTIEEKKLASAKQSEQSSHHQVIQQTAYLKQLAEQALSQDQIVNENQRLWQQGLQRVQFTDESAFEEACLTEQEQQLLANKIDAYKEKSISLAAALAQQELSIKDQQKPNIKQLKIDYQSAKQHSQQIFSAWQDSEYRYRLLEQLKTNVANLSQQLLKLEQDYQLWGSLSELANGQSGQKISLQRFVLSVLLDDVLLQASERLTIMTKNRYQLLRKQERAKGNRASGLELEIADSYTGATRSVATLSGGESFLAALALALGLSDVVQAYSGGIELETLFIDEGFGSLDQEALDLAIRTLMDLQSHGRTIGIISHVKELRELMALRIDLHSRNGSSKIQTIGTSILATESIA